MTYRKNTICPPPPSPNSTSFILPCPLKRGGGVCPDGLGGEINITNMCISAIALIQKKIHERSEKKTGKEDEGILSYDAAEGEEPRRRKVGTRQLTPKDGKDTNKKDRGIEINRSRSRQRSGRRWIDAHQRAANDALANPGPNLMFLNL